MPCPFEPKNGFSTEETRAEYLQVRLSRQEEGQVVDEEVAEEVEQTNANDSSIPPSPPTCLNADPDTTKPLYHWQLYSILGKDPIVTFITEFYKRIFDDTRPNYEWFRMAFVGVDPNPANHVKAQSNYWIDAFGGGRVYWGGLSRLGFHHNSIHAEPVMNERGAKRWLWHMKHAIRSYDFDNYLSSSMAGSSSSGSEEEKDERIVPTLVDFLKVKVLMYAKEHEWEFDETEFDVEEYTYGSSKIPIEPE
mmetsp:Transcript_34773/g.54297  ORF Transcript_34773/g.54297 Transcript_34773/m.54297 type:complete len:249 (+) Transcript_34773:127-873(+)